MNAPLSNTNIAILVANGVDELDMTEVQRALVSAGATPKTVSLEQGLVNSWHNVGWGHHFMVDSHVGEVLAADFDMLVIPGGERSIAKLSQSPHLSRILGSFLDGGKPVALLGAAVSLLVTTGRAAGRTVSAPEEYKDPVAQAGAVRSDSPVSKDGNLVTGNTEEDRKAIIDEMIELFLASIRDEQQNAA